LANSRSVQKCDARHSVGGWDAVTYWLEAKLEV
jgi:hypothetical protein